MEAAEALRTEGLRSQGLAPLEAKDTPIGLAPIGRPPCKAVELGEQTWRCRAHCGKYVNLSLQVVFYCD